MEIRNLLTFVTVAELNSFTKAAQALDYAQSTVSFQIKQIENELGCLLFERINHTLSLTDRGKELLIYAQNICRLTDEFHQHMNREKAVEGHIHILTPDSVCEAMLTENYADFYAKHPGITLKFSTADTDDMFRILDRNEADMMLTLDSHVYHGEYRIIKETQMSTHFVCGVSSPLAGKTVDIETLMEYPLILTEKGMGYRRVLDDSLAKRSVELKPVLEISRTDLITTLLEVGQHVSFLPDFVTRKKVEEGKLVYIDVPELHVEIWQQLICHRGKWISRALNTLIQYICEHEFKR